MDFFFFFFDFDLKKNLAICDLNDELFVMDEDHNVYNSRGGK